MRKASGNWMVGDEFFDREAELEVLAERFREGTHSSPTPLDYRSILSN